MPADGTYTFFADCDGILRLWADGKLILEKPDYARRDVQGKAQFKAGQSCQIRIDYIHRAGDSSAHVFGSGPEVRKQILVPAAP